MDRTTVEWLISRCVLVNAANFSLENTADLVLAVRMIPSNRRDRLMPNSHMTYKEAMWSPVARGNDASYDVQQETSTQSRCLPSERKLFHNLNRRPESTVGSQPNQGLIAPRRKETPKSHMGRMPRMHQQ